MFLIILGLLIVGIFTGLLLRNRLRVSMGPVINILVWLLLFILGIKVGSDERIVNGIATLGAEALMVCTATVAGSAVAAWGLWRIVRRREVR